MDLTFARYTLSNGIILIVKENHHAQSVLVRGRLQGGANLDLPEKAGGASMAAAMMRRGTGSRSFTQINQAVEAIGASVYVKCGRHLTAFGGKSLAEDFDILAELLVDNLLDPVFPTDEFEKVRSQRLTNLRELEDSPRSLAHRNFRQLLYGPDHPYGRPFNGTLKSIPNLTRNDLLEFYQNLHPKDGVIVVVGDVDSKGVFDTLESSLGKWQPGPEIDIPPLPTPRTLTETERYVHPMPDKSQVQVVLGNVGPTRFAKDFYAAHVGNAILGHLGLGGRIGKRVRQDEGLAYSARTDLSAGLGPTPWYFFAGVNVANVNKAINLILSEIEAFCDTLVTDEELADAKSYLTGVMPLQMESNEGMASALLESHLFQLGDDFIARYPEIINAVTRADIQAAAQKYLNSTVYALAIVGPYQQP